MEKSHQLERIRHERVARTYGRTTQLTRASDGLRSDATGGRASNDSDTTLGPIDDASDTVTEGSQRSEPAHLGSSEEARFDPHPNSGPVDGAPDFLTSEEGSGESFYTASSDFS
ncbi:MAG: hypothetical protein Q9174_003807 [Haloplaca sp. 1 TL-2023]